MNSYPYAEMMKKTIGNQLADVRGKQFTYDFTVHINNGSQVEGKARGCVDTGKSTISTAADIICSKCCCFRKDSLCALNLSKATPV